MADWLISAADYAFLAQWLRDQCALVLEPGKEYLLRNRLTPIIQRHQLADLKQLIERLRSLGAAELKREIVEAMVTTETSFFRDVRPFEMLRKAVIPDLIERRRGDRRLRIWCAASSSGQEPYSLAMLLREYFPELDNWNVTLLATDISEEMLKRCRAGRYSQLEVNRGLPTPLLLKWFRQDGGHWEINEQLRAAVTFSPLNLAGPWPPMGMWDIVLIRNVMIYFEPEVKRAILGRIARMLAKDGFLILGGTETTLNLDDSFRVVEALKAGFYQLKPPA
ncbi:MAG: Chemotaxis protein methyltransferase Cher2 [Planctomycetota bacterium]